MEFLIKCGPEVRSASRAVIPLAECYLDETQRALDACFTAFPNRVQSRGRAWDSGTAQIEAALKRHLELGPELLAAEMQTRNPSWSADAPILREHFDPKAQELLESAREFREGWTAPPGKHWHERHPMWWAAILLVLGAIAGAAASWLVDRPQSQQAAPAEPSPRPAPAGAA